MTTAAGFVAEVLPDARMASARTGVPVAVILAQWINETGGGTSSAWLSGHNYAGVSGNGQVLSYADKTAGLAAYIQTLLLPYYSAVRAPGQSDNQAAVALGQSRWAAGHYLNAAGGGPGSALVDLISADNLAGYDNGTASSSAGSGATATPAAFSIPNPLDVPGQIVKSLESDAAGFLQDTFRPLILKGLLLAGGVTLVVVAGYRASQPARQAIMAKADQAASAAAVAA